MKKQNSEPKQDGWCYMNFCGICKYWCFKVDAGHGAWGLCLNPKVQEAIRIEVSRCELTAENRREINEYGRIEFSEHNFGCIYHTEKKHETKQSDP